jgi:hypothetical protein
LLLFVPSGQVVRIQVTPVRFAPVSEAPLELANLSSAPARLARSPGS